MHDSPIVDTYHLSRSGWIAARRASPPLDRVETWECTTTWQREPDQLRGWSRPHHVWACVWTDGSLAAERDRLRLRHPVPDRAGPRVRIGEPAPLVET